MPLLMPLLLLWWLLLWSSSWLLSALSELSDMHIDNICFIDDAEANTGTCGSFCTADRADLCTGPYQACVDSNIEGLGLCQGFCNLEDNTGCDEGNSCMFLFGGLLVSGDNCIELR